MNIAKNSTNKKIQSTAIKPKTPSITSYIRQTKPKNKDEARSSP